MTLDQLLASCPQAKKLLEYFRIKARIEARYESMFERVRQHTREISAKSK